MDYKIISVKAADFIKGTDFPKSTIHLADLVNKEIQQGWKPIGGVAVYSTQSPYLFQPMVKE